jgi:hypothetical protein
MTHEREFWLQISSYLNLRDYDSLRNSTKQCNLSIYKFCFQEEYLKEEKGNYYTTCLENPPQYAAANSLKYIGFSIQNYHSVQHIFNKKITQNWERLIVLPDEMNFGLLMTMYQRNDFYNLNRMIPYLEQLSLPDRNRLFRLIEPRQQSERILTALYQFGITDHKTAFFVWCCFGQLDYIKKEMKITSQWNRGFQQASLKGNVKVVEFLLPYVDPTTDQNSCLRFASADGYPTIVRLLLEDGRSDPTSCNHYCFRWACERRHCDIIQLLIEDSRMDRSFCMNWATENQFHWVLPLFNDH